MNPTRAVLWMLGVVFLLAGAYLLYFEAGLNRWVSIGVLLAGFLLFIGIAVMSFASGSPSDTPNTVVKEGGGQPINVDSRTTNVEAPRTRNER